MKRKIILISLLALALTSCSSNTYSSNFKNTEKQVYKSLPSRAERDLAVKKQIQDRQEWIKKYGSDIKTIKKYALLHNDNLNPSRPELVICLENDFFNYSAIVKALDELDINYSENARKRVVNLTNYNPSITPKELQEILLNAGFTVDEIINMNEQKEAKVEEANFSFLEKTKDINEIKKEIVKSFNETYEQFGLKAEIYDLHGYTFLITCIDNAKSPLSIKDIFIKKASHKILNSLESEYYLSVEEAIKSFSEAQAIIHRTAFSLSVENPVEKNKSMFTIMVNDDGKANLLYE